MTKAERWQARKDLIAKGSNSLYPDAQIAAKRLAANNIAVEKAKLAENVYKTVNPLETTPGVPEGWKDISNDAGAEEVWPGKRCFLIAPMRLISWLAFISLTQMCLEVILIQR
jgi:hypothetical protein